MKVLVRILRDLGVTEQDWLEFGQIWRIIGQKEVWNRLTWSQL